MTLSWLAYAWVGSESFVLVSPGHIMFVVNPETYALGMQLDPILRILPVWRFRSHRHRDRRSFPFLRARDIP